MVTVCLGTAFLCYCLGIVAAWYGSDQAWQLGTVRLVPAVQTEVAGAGTFLAGGQEGRLAAGGSGILMLLVVLLCLGLLGRMLFYGYRCCRYQAVALGLAVCMAITGYGLTRQALHSSWPLRQLLGQEVLVQGVIEPASLVRRPEGWSFLLRAEQVAASQRALQMGSRVKAGEKALVTTSSETQVQPQTGAGEKALVTMSPEAQVQPPAGAGEKALASTQAAKAAVADQLAGRPVRQCQVRVFVRQPQNKKAPWLQPGTVRLQGTLLPIQEFANPGCQNWALNAQVRGLCGRMQLRGDQMWQLSTSLSGLDALASKCQLVRTRALAQLPSREGALLLGMMLGGYQGLEADVAATFRDNGLAHLLAVSGTHVALVTAVLLVLLRPLPYRVRTLLLIGLLGVYAVCCGLAPAVIRSVIMGAVLLWERGAGSGGGWLERSEGKQEEAAIADLSGEAPETTPDLPVNPTASTGLEPTSPPTKKVIAPQRLAPASPRRPLKRLHLLLLTAWFMLAWKPLWLLDISFQLSFLTMLGLVVLYRPLLSYVPSCLPSCIRETLAITLTAQVTTLPVVVWYFHRFSLIGLVSNLLLVPALGVAVLCGAAGLLLHSVVPCLGAIFLGGSLILLRGALGIGRLLALVPGAVLNLRDWGWLRSVLYYGVLGLFFEVGGYCPGGRRRRLLLSGVVLFVGLGLWQSYRPQPLTIHHLDVGQGDCALVVTPERYAFLIDTGGLPGSLDTGSSLVVPYLRYLGIERLEALFISHGDFDHVGGTEALLKEVPVARLLLAAGEEGPTLAKLLPKVPADCTLFRLEPGARVRIGSCQIEVLAGGRPAVTKTVAAAGSSVGAQASAGKAGALPTKSRSPDELVPAFGERLSLNDQSLVLSLQCGKHRALFTGDASSEVEKSLEEGLSQVDHLKVGHHGSGTSTSQAFLQKLRPATAVISVGRGNRYGHPSPETLARLQQSGTQLLRTDILGAIQVRFDEEGIKWYSYRYQKQYF